MTIEGLWPAKQSFDGLRPDERAILLHGYWRRPGPGSFLKTSHSKPEEVSSWLRWDGLYRAILSEIDRSKASEWVKQIRATTRSNLCPICAGTGLQDQARAIKIGSQSFFEWVRKGTVKELVKTLGALAPPSERSKRMRKRILHCLEPLSRTVPHASLREPVGDAKLLRDVYERTVQTMTRLEVLG